MEGVEFSREELVVLLRERGENVMDRFEEVIFLSIENPRLLSILNNKVHRKTISNFASLIVNQRLNMLKENLKKVVVPPKRTRQVRLTDFFKSSDKQPKISLIRKATPQQIA